MLFRESVICLVNPWGWFGSRIDKAQDPKLREIVQTVYKDMVVQVHRIMLRLISELFSQDGLNGEQTLQIDFGHQMKESCDSGREGAVRLPKLFHALYNCDLVSKPLRNKLEVILRNRSRFVWLYLKAGYVQCYVLGKTCPREVLQMRSVHTQYRMGP